MVRKILPGLYQLRETLVCSYLLRHGDAICLIDGGFLKGIENLEACLKLEGLGWENITTVLLTHGHLDHTYNLAEIRRRSAAAVYAHPLDTSHIHGSYPYRGVSRVCGTLQACGRKLFGFSSPDIDLPLSDQQTIPFGNGIRVLHTPGHTEGHCCFFWEERRQLFAGDLFATGKRRTFLPPAFLNSCPETYSHSLQNVLNLDAEGMLSNHCDQATPKEQRERFHSLAASLGLLVASSSRT